MSEVRLRLWIETAIDVLKKNGVIGQDLQVEIELERPARPEHGHFSTNLALVLAKEAGTSPRQLAETLVDNLSPSDLVIKTEVAGPGFINFFLSDKWIYETILEIAAKGAEYGRSTSGGGTRIQVEFGSANPTGPLHVGSGRNIAYGDALARLLESKGHNVSRENYLNDVGNQVDRLARSVNARYLQALGHEAAVPDDGYQGEYLIDLGKELAEQEGMGYIDNLEEIRKFSIERIIESQRQTLEKFGVVFDNWFREQSLHDSGQVLAGIDRLTQLGFTYESEGALWFKGSEAGAPRNQPLIKSNGDSTYLAADIAYLIDKVARGFDKAIYVWGADHHGNVATTIAAARVLGLEDRIEILMYQLVNFIEDGAAVRMARRRGNIITMDDLIDEVGADAARFTFLNRNIDSTIDFDFEIVKQQSQDNPVYYVQYAHARTCSILRYATDQSLSMTPPSETEISMLIHDSEQALLRKLSEYPSLIEEAATLRAPYRLTNFSHALASLFSAFYRDCRVITEDISLTAARLRLVDCTRQVLSNCLGILGITAPDRM